MERNLRWFRWHQLVAGALFWAPTTFLYLIARFGLSTALQAQVVYYVAVVVLEVPSGWFSDRFGRVLPLRTVAVAWVGAHALFLTEPGFAGIAVAQVLLAAGYAFLSGSDTTFHLERPFTIRVRLRSDRPLGDGSRSIAVSAHSECRRGSGIPPAGPPDDDGWTTYELKDREAAVRRGPLWPGAASAPVGGALGTIDLRLPFAAALLAAAVQFVLALRLTEPPVVAAGANDPGGLVAGIGHLRTPLLGWITAFVGVSVVSAHLAADLAAPYLTEVLDTDPEAPGAAALLNGAVAAVVAAVAAVALHIVVPTGRRFGPVRTLLLLLVVPVVILMAMAGVTSLWLLPLMTIRRLPSAAVSVFAPPLVAGFVGPRSRATFLSMASFVGRLAYAGVLLAPPRARPQGHPSHQPPSARRPPPPRSRRRSRCGPRSMSAGAAHHHRLTAPAPSSVHRRGVRSPPRAGGWTPLSRAGRPRRRRRGARARRASPSGPATSSAGTVPPSGSTGTDRRLA